MLRGLACLQALLRETLILILPFPFYQWQDYTYYGLASPWLHVKCLRVLQYFPAPEEPSVRRTLVDVVKRILGGEHAYALTCCGAIVHALICSAHPGTPWAACVTCSSSPPPYAERIAQTLSALSTLLQHAAGSEQVKNVNKNNAVHAIVFEAVAVAIALDEPELMAMGVALLAKFLSVSTATAQLCVPRGWQLCVAALPKVLSVFHTA